MESYVNHDEWFEKEVRKSVASLDRGEFIEHDEVVSRIELVRWSPEAYNDLARIVQHIRGKNPYCRATCCPVEDVSASGPSWPRGWNRELVLSTLPFLVIYRENAVDVVRVLHGAQRWP